MQFIIWKYYLPNTIITGCCTDGGLTIPFSMELWKSLTEGDMQSGL